MKKYKVLVWYPKSKDKSGIVIGIYTDDKCIEKAKKYIQNTYKYTDYDIFDESFEVVERPIVNDVLPEIWNLEVVLL